MFQVNDTVSYAASGICQVVDITTQKSGKSMVRYYVLRPVYNQGSTIFVPTENETLVARMRQVLSQQEVLDLIHGLPEAEDIWIDGESDRQSRFKEILQSGDQKRVLQVIKSLHQNQRRCQKAGRKFRVSDERMMKAAESVLHEEFAYALGMPKEQVADFIIKEIS